MRVFFAMTAALLAGLAAPAPAQDFDPMQFADTDGDRKVSAEEFTTFQTGGWGFVSQGADKVNVAALDPMMKPMMDGIAPDAEGNITAAAFTAYIPTRFKNSDKDGDGSLSEAELRASIGMPPA